MGSGNRRTGIVGRLAVAAGLLLGTAALAAGGPVAAQEEPPRPTATAVADCVGETGRIVVTIVDDDPYRYDILIGGAVVAADVSDGPDGLNVFEPYADGAYTVVVNWIALDDDEPPFGSPDPVLSTTVTVDCVADVTTTAAPTTAAPTTAAPTTAAPTTAAPTTAAPTTAAPAAAPTRLPATGPASTAVALIAGALTLAGGALLVARRQPGRV
jgi:LPXTG-motif cell wall-anchored protein